MFVWFLLVLVVLGVFFVVLDSPRSRDHSSSMRSSMRS